MTTTEGPDALTSLVAGATAGTVAATITCPLEVLKTRLQSASATKMRPDRLFVHIVRTEGVAGLFRGLSANLLGVAPARAVYFLAYRTVKDQLRRADIRGSLQHLVAGATASIIQSTVTSPIWVVKTRIQLDERKADGSSLRLTGIWNATKRIWRREGYRGFYRGLGASYLGAMESMLQLTLYERFKMEHRRIEHREPSSLSTFFAGGLAKMTASCISYPHEVVRTRLREIDGNARPLYRGIVHCVQTTVREEGFKALYGGLGVHLIRTVPNAAILFLVVEICTGRNL